MLAWLRSAHSKVKDIRIEQNSTWYAEASCFRRSGVAQAFDEVAVKDPSIVYTNGKYHLYYTGVNGKGWWQLGYASAATLAGLAFAEHIYLSSLKENYFCAPQVFYFEPQKKWYLIYQDGEYGAAYATTEKIDDPASWLGPRPLGISGPCGYDFWLICDKNYAYVFYTPDGNTRTIVRRRTSLKNFPAGWGPPVVVAAGAFEAVCVYKCLADGRYYMLPEDFHDNRHYALWTAKSLNGPWKNVAARWITQSNIVFKAEPWTTSVSHGEIIRAGVNQELEIQDINRIDFLIQGMAGGDFSDYAHITWDLGLIRNYSSL